MPPKRKNEPPLPRCRSTRRWPTRQAEELNNALNNACSSNTADGWSKADRLLTGLGDLAPECLLPDELAVRIVGLNLEPLPAVLWRIVGAYADCHADVVTNGREKLAFARVICLYGMNRADDALTMAEPLLPYVNASTTVGWSDYNWSDLAFELFRRQQYEQAARLYGRLSVLQNGNYSKSESRTMRGISLLFLGQIDDAKSEIDGVDGTYYVSGWIPSGWIRFARILLTVPFPNRAQCILRFRSELRWNVADDDAETRFLRCLCSSIAADDGRYPIQFDAEWLRGRHADACRKSDCSAVTFTPFCSVDISLMLSSSSSDRTSKRLKS